MPSQSNVNELSFVNRFGVCWNKKKKNLHVWEDDEERKNATLPTQFCRIGSLHVIQVAALSINACVAAFRLS